VTAPPTVTALRARARGRVEIEIDGARWRVVPLEAVHRAGLFVGVTLERNRARELRREIRRLESLEIALGALRRRDHTAASLQARLARRGVATADRDTTLAALRRTRLVDDERFAHSRSASLAERGAGDQLIAADLEQHGVPPDIVVESIALLEAERLRAERIVRSRGLTPKTLRALAAKGFAEASLEGLVAQMEDEAVG
jgi:SOS response regulatory protein OraA/RecX